VGYKGVADDGRVRLGPFFDTVLVTEAHGR
jgi:hypothetical protein